VLLDPYARDFVADPYPTYRRLLTKGHVHPTTCGIPAVCRYDDCVHILTDHRWSVDPRAVDPVRTLLFTSQEPKSQPIPKLDPPDHTAVRRLMRAPLAPPAVRRLDAVVRRITDELLDGMAGRGSTELMSAFAVPLAVRTIGEMMGVPPEDMADVAAWSREVARKMELDALGPDAADRHEKATASLRGLFAELVADCRREPKSNLLSALVTAQHNGRGLDDSELAINATMLAMAAGEPSISFIGNAIVSLLSHRPEHLQRLRDDPRIEELAIEELVRFNSPLQMRPRAALSETVVGDTTFRAGDQVLVLLAAANRDRREFEDPDALDLTRRRRRHLAFGAGRHFCLGAHLARLEARVAVTSLIRRFPSISLAADALVEYEPRFALRRPARVEVELGAPSTAGSLA
jgi:cytochrome P450